MTDQSKESATWVTVIIIVLGGIVFLTAWMTRYSVLDEMNSENSVAARQQLNVANLHTVQLRYMYQIFLDSNEVIRKVAGMPVKQWPAFPETVNPSTKP